MRLTFPCVLQARLLLLVLVWLLALSGSAYARQGNGAGGGSVFSQDPLAQALQQSDVYIGKTLQNRIDARSLQALTQTPGRARPMKIVVVTQLPASGAKFGTRDDYTAALHNYLNLGPGLLLIVTQNGVSAYSNLIPPDPIPTMLEPYAASIKQDPVGGITQAVHALDATVARLNGDPTGGGNTGPSGGGGFAGYWWLLPVGLGGVGVVGLMKRSAARRQALQAATVPVQRLRGEVVEGIAYVDNYLDLLPESAEHTAALRQRQEAAALLEQAKTLARTAHTPQDYGRVEALLEQAKTNVTAIRSFVDVATGGTGFAVAVTDTTYRATPATANGGVSSFSAPVVSGLRAEDIPESERAACFFCSRPARITDLTPIDVAVNGQRRKVLACADDVRIIQQGAIPAVRTVSSGGRQVPWYSSRAYNPYRDYGYTEVSYLPSYYSYGPDDGFAEGFLLGSLMSQPEPMPYPIFIASSGEATGDPQAAILSNPPIDGGASDFFGGNSADAGLPPPDNGGGADYSSSDSGGSDFGTADFSSSDSGSSDSGGNDYSSSDSGSSSDFGSSDFSSSDSSSSDFGSSDSGSSDSGSSGGGDY